MRALPILLPKPTAWNENPAIFLAEIDLEEPITPIIWILPLLDVYLFLSHNHLGSLTYNGRRNVQPILCAVQPILFHKMTVSWTEIVVQQEIAPFMTRNPFQQRLQACLFHLIFSTRIFAGSFTPSWSRAALV